MYQCFCYYCQSVCIILTLWLSSAAAATAAIAVAAWFSRSFNGNVGMAIIFHICVLQYIETHFEWSDVCFRKLLQTSTSKSFRVHNSLLQFTLFQSLAHIQRETRTRIHIIFKYNMYEKMNIRFTGVHINIYAYAYAYVRFSWLPCERSLCVYLFFLLFLP